MALTRGAEIWQQREWRGQLQVWRGQRVKSAAESGKAVTKPPTTPEGKQKLVPRHDESSRMSAELIGKAEDLRRHQELQRKPRTRISRLEGDIAPTCSPTESQQPIWIHPAVGSCPRAATV